jgi:hypothetical protein
LNQEDIIHFSKSIKNYESKAAIKSVPKKKSPGPDEFYRIFKEELMLALLKVFHEIERKGTLPKSFYEANILLFQKPE